MYDGVHRGHQKLIGAAVSRARAMRRPCLLLTFDPHPAEVVRPGSHPAILTSLDRKAELVAELGVDAMCVLPFTQEFMRLSPETFTHTVLVEQLHAAQVVVGENFTYGHKAAGDVASLTREGRRFGFAVEGVALAEDASDDGDGDHLLDLHPGLRRGGRHGVGRARARPAAPGRRRRRPGRPAGPGHGLPDGERGEPAVHRDPGRRRVRRAPGDPRRRAAGPAGSASRPRSRSAATRPSRAAGARSRPSSSTTTATCTASTWASSSCSGCARWRRSPTSRRCSRPWRKDVTDTRAILGM